jgi:hypothetical protein
MWLNVWDAVRGVKGKQVVREILPFAVRPFALTREVSRGTNHFEVKDARAIEPGFDRVHATFRRERSNSRKFPVPREKFPVRVRREFARKPLNLRRYFLRKRAK